MTPLLGMYLDKTVIWKGACTSMFTAALFTRAKTRKQPKCPSTEKWTQKMWYTHTHTHTHTCHGSQPCRAEGACITQWSYEPCHVGLPKMEGSQWRILTRHGPLEEGMANHSSILAARTPGTPGMIRQRDDAGRWAPPGRKVSNGQRALANSSRENEAAGPKQKWPPVVGVSGGESKV